MGRIGAIVALLGLLSYLVGHSIETVFGLAVQEIGIFYAAGALMVGLGMLPLGMVALLARRLIGWRRFAPLCVGLYYAAMIPVQLVFFIGPNGAPSPTLLGMRSLGGEGTGEKKGDRHIEEPNAPADAEPSAPKTNAVNDQRERRTSKR